MSDILETLRLHRLWLRGEDGGVRANLLGANLCGANLGDANLGDADLGGANLRCADLGDADLGGANLRCADLGDADLRGANLRGANLRDANLCGANLLDAIGYTRFISIGPVGSRNDKTHIAIAEDKVWCGCFVGTLTEFADAVTAKHADNPQHIAEYMALIEFAKAIRSANV